MNLLVVGSLVASARPRGVQAGVAPPAGLEQAYAPRRVALVVGIDAFDDPAVSDLRFAAKDARDLAAVLQDPVVGAYDTVSVVAGRVTREAFWHAFEEVTATLHPVDTLFVYVASHGSLTLGSGGTELVVVPTDGSPYDAARTGIRVADLVRAVDDTDARRTVMILDACYAGTGRSVVAPQVEEMLSNARGAVPAPAALVSSGLSAHLYAAHVHQPALEDPRLENGVYTHFLIEALGGAADSDHDGLVEVMEAHQWARDRTLAHTGGVQVPWVESVLVGREELYLAGDPRLRSRVEIALLDGLKRLPEGTSLRIDGTQRRSATLPVGRHHIELVSGDEVLLSMRQAVSDGDVVDLGRELRRRQAHTELSMGVATSTGDDWLGAIGGLVDLRYAPADPRGGRWSWGVATRLGAYRSADRSFPAATIGAIAAWTHRLGPLALGPSLELGVAARLPGNQPGPQASPLAAPGLELRTDVGPMFGRVVASVPMIAGNRELVALPTLGVGLGWRAGW